MVKMGKFILLVNSVRVLGVLITPLHYIYIRRLSAALTRYITGQATDTTPALPLLPLNGYQTVCSFQNGNVSH